MELNRKHIRTQARRAKTRRLRLRRTAVALLACGGISAWLPGNAFAGTISGVGSRTIEVNGQAVYHVPGLVAEGTTYMPIWYVQQVLTRIGIDNTWNGQEWDISQSGSAKGVGFHHAGANTAERAIVLNGQIAYKVDSIVYQGTTYMPIWYIQQVIQKLGDTSTWNRPTWNIVLGAGQHYQYPTRFGTGSTKTLSINGKSVYRLPGIDHGSTTYLPIWYIQRALDDVGLQNLWYQGQQWDISTKSVTPEPVTNAVNQAGERTIFVDGKKAMELPYFVYQGTTYMQVYSIENLLRQLGLTTTWNGWTWDISQPSVAAPSSTAPTVFGFMTNYSSAQTSLDDAEQHPGQITEMGTFMHEVTADGHVTGAAPSATLTYAAQQNVPVLATVTNLTNTGFNGSEIDAILKSQTDSDTLVKSIVQAVSSEGYSGAVLDFEGIAPSDGSDYGTFVASVAQALHNAGKQLVVAVPADTGPDNEPWNDGYPYAQIGAAADQVIVMAYDASYPGSTAGPIAPVPWVRHVLSYASQTIPPSKILLGIDAYGYDWVTHTTQAKALSLSAVDGLLQSNQITPLRDAASDAPYFQYTASGVSHTVYYEDAQSTTDKLNIARQFGIAGIAIWHIGLDNQAIWSAIGNYTASSTAIGASSTAAIGVSSTATIGASSTAAIGVSSTATAESSQTTSAGSTTSGGAPS